MATHSRRPERVAQLTGRSSELSVLDRLIDVVRGGQSRVLVVSGEPGVGLVFAARVPDEDLAGLPGLEVGGLRAADARALLDSVLAGPLDARVRDRFVAETGGNPLALLELPRGVTSAELAGGFGLPGALPGAIPLAGRIEETFGRRIQALGPRQQTPASAGGGGPVRRVVIDVASRRSARNPASGGDPGGRRRAGRVRHPGTVPASAGTFRGLPVSIAAGPPGSAQRAGRSYRCAGRSGSPGLAPGPGCLASR